MIDPLKNIDRWAARSANRAGIADLDCHSIGLGAFRGARDPWEKVWYTAPPRVTHLDQAFHTHV